jgi:hypothetical protein
VGHHNEVRDRSVDDGLRDALVITSVHMDPHHIKPLFTDSMSLSLYTDRISDEYLNNVRPVPRGNRSILSQINIRLAYPIDHKLYQICLTNSTAFSLELYSQCPLCWARCRRHEHALFKAIATNHLYAAFLPPTFQHRSYDSTPDSPHAVLQASTFSCPSTVLDSSS